MSPVQRWLLYSGVNVVAFVFNVFTAWLLTVQGMHYVFATVGGYLVHITIVFIVNHTWIFRYVKMHRGFAVVRMGVVHFGSFVLVMTVTPICVELLGMGYLAARLIASVCAGLWDYVLDSYFTFGVHPFR